MEGIGLHGAGSRIHLGPYIPNCTREENSKTLQVNPIFLQITLQQKDQLTLNANSIRDSCQLDI